MKRKISFILPILLLVALIGVYMYFAIYFQSHTLFKTTVKGIPVDKLTKEQTQDKLHDRLKTTSFDIINQSTEWKKIPKEDLGMTYDIEKTTNNIFSKQNPWSWPLAFFQKQEYPAVTAPTNEKKLTATLEQVKVDLEAYNKEQTQTKDASIEFIDNHYTIVKEVQGASLNLNQAMTQIKKDILEGQANVNLTSFIEKPKTVSTDKELVAAVDEIERLNSQPISYSINGQKIEVPKEISHTWFTFADQKVALDKDKIKEYITELGNKYNTSTNFSKFNSTKRGEVTVPAGAYSWTIATDAEVAELSNLLLAGNGVENRVPSFQGSATPGAALIGNTYIEVDLQAQHMWLYKDGKSVLDTPVVTGKPSTPTPPGVFYVWNKKEDEILRGEDYASPVDYWMPIDWTGVGIHDSPWQNADAYGGTSYKTVGSHGCINTPPAVCAKLFSMIDVGIPVIIF